MGKREVNKTIKKLINLLEENKINDQSDGIINQTSIYKENNLQETPTIVLNRLQAYLTEFIGVFFIALSAVLSNIYNNPVFSALSSGGIIISLIYAGGHISQAHYNPAMTIIFFLRNEKSLLDSIVYIIIQISAAFFGMFIGFLLIPNGTNVYIYEPNSQYHSIQIFFLEILYSFLLGWVVLNVATAHENEGNEFYGIGVGSMIIGSIMTIGSSTGSCLNPSLGLSNLVFHSIKEKSLSKLSNIWIYCLGPIIGSLFSCFIFYITHSKELVDIFQKIKQKGIKNFLV